MDEGSSSSEPSSDDEVQALARIFEAEIDDEYGYLLVDDSTEPSAEEESNDDVVQRVPFDHNLPSTHQYLRLPRVDDSFFEFKPLDADTILSVSIIKLPVVMFPNQLLPFHASDNVTVRQLLDASKTGALIALKPNFNANVHHIATLIQVVQVSTANDEETVSIHAMGRQRCRILEERSALNGMRYGDVKILEDKELGPFIPYDISRGFGTLRLSLRLSAYSHLTAHHSYVIKQGATSSFVYRIVHWLTSWYPDDKIKAHLSEGLTAFSYWVAANIPVDMLIRLRLLEESCADRRLVNEYFHLLTVDRIVCKQCGTLLCHLSEIISISTEGNSALYVNPSGYVHDMFTVSKLHSTRPQGNPSEEYSWFPGYQWTIQNCARCHSFIGWRFTSKSLTPRYFYGISRGAVCPSGRNAAVNEDFRDSLDEYIFLRL